MSKPSRRHSMILASTLIAMLAAVVGVLLVHSGHSTARPPAVASCARGITPTLSRAILGASLVADRAVLPAGPSVVSLGPATTSQPIRAGFLGVSLEYEAVTAYAGTTPQALNPVFVQLIRNLTPGQAPVLRIGGDSTDWTWRPVPHLTTPAGVFFNLTPAWLGVTQALVRSLDARVILGVNLEADSTTIAAAEANALVRSVGRANIFAFELGNEPELYGSFVWGESCITGRAHGYDFAAFNRDFSRIGQALGTEPLAGPTTGSPKWFPDLAQFLATAPRVSVVTLHRYPLQLCYIRPSSSLYPTIGNLLSVAATHGLADSVAAYVGVAHARGLQLRIDEMNTISCGQAPAVGESFASALWVLDALFEMARVNVDGVNIHTYPQAPYELFTFARAHRAWRAFVEPEYYGMLMFAQAAPAGSRLLRLNWRPYGGNHPDAWATRAPDGQVHVVLINDTLRRETVALAAPAGAGASALARLQAPSILANRGVTLGGQSFGSETQTGLLAGRPAVSSITPVAGKYVVVVPGGSAAMLTLAKP
jgi:hypothetical protein